MKKILFMSVLLFVAISISACFQQEKIKKLELNIRELKKEMSSIRFKITKRSRGSIFVSLKYYNLDGDELKTEKHKIKGSELDIDFMMIKVDGGFLSFPYRLFSDYVAPADGVSILNDYNNDGMPEIYLSKNNNSEFVLTIKSLYQNLLEDKKRIEYGCSVHDIGKGKGYRSGVVYKVVAHKKGGLEVVEN